MNMSTSLAQLAQAELTGMCWTLEPLVQETVVGILTAGGVGGTYDLVVEGETAAGGVDFAAVQVEDEGVGDGFVDGVFTAGGTVVLTAVHVEDVEGVGDGCLAAGGVLQVGTAGTNTVVGVLTAGGVGGTYGRVVEGDAAAGGVGLLAVQLEEVEGFLDGVFTAGGTVVLTAVQVDEVEGVGDGCFAAGGVLHVGTAGTNTVVGVLAAGGVGETYGRVVEGDTAAGGVDFTEVHDEEAGVGFVEGVLTAGGTVVLTAVHVVVEGVGDGCLAAGGVLQLGTAGTNTVEGVLTAGGVGGKYGRPVVEGVTTAGGVDLTAVQVDKVDGVALVEGVFTAGGVDLAAVQEDVVGFTEGVGEGCFAAGTAGTNTVVGVLAAGGVGGTYGRVVEGDTAAGGVDFTEVHDEEAGVGFVEGVLTAGGTVVLTAVHVVVEGVGDGCVAAGGVLQLEDFVEGEFTAGGVFEVNGFESDFVLGELTAGGVDLLVVHEDGVGEGCFAAGGVLQLGTAGTTTEDGVLTAGGVGSTYGTLVAGDAAAGGVDFAVQDEVNGEATAGGVAFEDSVQERVEGESAAGGVVLTGVEVQLLDAEWAPAGGRLG
ncbi:hypothetical protein HDU78_002979 [Chytriomyces hyalinus]|nr:hypothetical protein HDU78_002979 [Chytriomyces hyalinus]